MNAVREVVIEKMKQKAFWRDGKTTEEKKEIEEMKKEIGKILESKNEELARKSVTVKQLFNSVTFYEVMEYVRGFGVEVDEEYELQYKDVFEKVKNKEEKEEKNFIKVDFEEEGTPDVYSLEFDNGQHYSFSLVPYSELANYKVFPTLFEEKTKEEIAAGVLEEFMWASDDEYKEDMKEELKEATEEVEKYKEIEKAEAEGTLSIFKNENVAKPFVLGKDDGEISETETIRQFIKEVKIKDIKEALRIHYEEYGYDDVMIKTQEETYEFIAKEIFNVKKKINELEEKERGYKVDFEPQNNVIEVEIEGKEFECLYCGDYCYELVDERIRRKRYFLERTKEEIVLYFLLSIYRKELCVNEGDEEKNRERVEITNFTLAKNKILEKAKKGFEELTYDELITVSRSLENMN